jgi:predicted RNA binding protein YcfA (HicA-like mRNA interferase family)
MPPPFGPIKRRDLIAALRRAGFSGPYAGTKHQVMQRGTFTIRVPNPHRGDISHKLLAEILRQCTITREQWEQL